MPVPELQEMCEAFQASSTGPLELSRYWIELNRKNLSQLEREGYANFKRTLALNYFTWMLSPLDGQVKFLVRNVPAFSFLKSCLMAFLRGRHGFFSWPQSLSYNFLTYMLHEYVSRTVDPAVTGALYEPSEGNPPEIRMKNKLISQDLSNSILEFVSITSAAKSGSFGTMMELGAGYGRTAFVFLKQIPADFRYIIVDIPPALYVSQRYLSSQFPERKIFRFRKFDDYAGVAEEFESSEIAFLLPSQLRLLPPKSIDLFISISSLQEMRRDQIEYFFAQIERLTARYFYLKQWKVSRIPFDNIVIREEDYPARGEWTRLFRRECLVQTDFFEAMYAMKGFHG